MAITSDTLHLSRGVREGAGVGLGGRLLTSLASPLLNSKCDREGASKCGEGEGKVQCGRCSHTLAHPRDLEDHPSPHSLSRTSLPLFGLPNVTIQEFSNPQGVHFRVLGAGGARCRGEGGWVGGDTWYPGHQWRLCVCPVCGAAVGWQWRREGGTPGEEEHWVGLRLGRVADWEHQLLGPLMDLPRLAVRAWQAWTA